ncbi:exodeoxyribonuclease V subunit gamma [Methylomicrobium lacus]|uniref:exodeoxyribonuclease V subunit gamma n=1 Tax=Methylomicrobium lacus TaxID=136992 RepID=UPI0004A39DE3|nr:exodeoxyribonuclease V subunit gamma [Methylomicrobium lacus]
MTDSQLTPGFMIIHGNQPELLRQVIVSWMKAHPLDPLEDEVILVQSNGIAQWLKQALAADESASLTGGCGIAAALQTLLPSRFVWQAYRAVIGKDAVPDASPFDKPLLVWRLMRLLPRLTQEKGYEPLARFLSQDSDQRKRYQLAERLADLFDQYQVYRADWLAAWAEGRNILIDYQASQTPLYEEQVWQPMLWRALQADVGDGSHTSRAAVHQRFLVLASGLARRPDDLPRRVIVFGLSSLPKQSLEVLMAISQWTQVVLCINNPCEHHWTNILTEKDFLRRIGRHTKKPTLPENLKEEELHFHAHPLLAAWGKQGRDYISLLDEMDEPGKYRQLFAEIGQRIDLFGPHGEGCLLNQLQDDIRDLRPMSESRHQWPPVDPQRDPSIRFHVTHSPQREVEVLHDQLLAALDADPSLKPREIIVMVPDINQFAPHIQAVFGQLNPADKRYIPYSIADLGKRHQAPLVYSLELLLGIDQSRLAVSEVLDLLNVPAVRKRFNIEESDLLLLHQWIAQANIRWGLHARHRQSLGINFDYEQNTWTFGLKRMLLGYAVGVDPTGRQANDWNDIEPYGDVAGLDAALAGPLAHLLTKIEALLQTFAKPVAPAEWGERLRNLLLDFFESTDNDETYLLLQLQTSLEQWVDACENAALTEPLTLPVVRDYWLSQIDQGGLSQRFFAGSLTFATLMPMRAIPFRRIYLLGMNDGDYPRTHPAMDFDLMAKDYRLGDRSRREDDRYLFLEALLSAREHLHISWVGRSIHDNTERPPSVLVSQLRDHIATCWRLEESAGGKKLLEALTIEHRMQPFSKDYFGGNQAKSSLFTYAREWRPTQATRAASAKSSTASLALPVFDVPVSLDQLIGFMKDPVKTFFRERLGVYYELDDLTSEDQEPFSIGPLAQWALQNELIQVRLDAKRQGKSESESVQRQLARVRRQGILPTGSVTELLQEWLAEPLDAMFDQYETACQAWPMPLEDEDIAFEHTVNGQMLKIQGRLTQLFADAEQARCRIEINTSNLIENKTYRRDRLISAWIQHLAGHLDGQPLTTHLIGKNGQVVLRPLDPEWATRCFKDLIEAYVAGLCFPLPFAPKTALAWLAKGGKGFSGPLNECRSDAVVAAKKTYEGNHKSPGEAANNPYLQRIYPTLDSLWSDGDFTVWAERLLSPLDENVGKKAETDQGAGESK